MLNLPLGWIIIGTPTVPPKPTESGIVANATLSCDDIFAESGGGTQVSGLSAATVDLLAFDSVPVSAAGAHRLSLVGCALSADGSTTAGRSWSLLVALPPVVFDLGPGAADRDLDVVLGPVLDTLLEDPSADISRDPTSTDHAMLAELVQVNMFIEGGWPAP